MAASSAARLGWGRPAQPSAEMTIRTAIRTLSFLMAASWRRNHTRFTAHSPDSAPEIRGMFGERYFWPAVRVLHLWTGGLRRFSAICWRRVEFRYTGSRTYLASRRPAWLD